MSVLFCGFQVGKTVKINIEVYTHLILVNILKRGSDLVKEKCLLHLLHFMYLFTCMKHLLKKLNTHDIYFYTIKMHCYILCISNIDIF